MVNLCYVRSFVVQIAYDTNVNFAYVVHNQLVLVNMYVTFAALHVS